MKLSNGMVLAALVLVLAGAAYLLGQAHHAMPQPEVQLLASTVTVPLDLTKGLPVVQVTLNGKGPYNFALDTGAAGTVISESLAQELNLEVRGQAEVHSPAGNHPLPGKIVSVDRLELGKAVLTNVFAIAFDASNVFRTPDAPRGVLSANSFAGYLLTLNYPKATMELRRGELPEADNIQTLDFDASRPLISIPIRVGGIELRADLDSGSVSGIVLPAKYAAQLPLIGGLTQGETRHTVDATVEHQKGTLNGQVRIGGITVQNPDIMFSNIAKEGNLGSKFLSRYVVTLDRKNHRIQLKEG